MINTTEHCGTCSRFKATTVPGYGNCALMENYRLRSCIGPCAMQPSQWMQKVNSTKE